MKISRILAILVLPDRFWSRLRYEAETGCWIWPGYFSGKGYGKFGFRGKKYYLHRLIWSLTHGPIPARMQVCHTCDTPPCCNPFHLFLGTSLDNHKDMVEKGRALFGERNAAAKLTENNVIELLERYKLGETQSAIADSLGISRTHVSKIIRKEKWKHVSS